jgi:hypothetical protein
MMFKSIIRVSEVFCGMFTYKSAMELVFHNVVVSCGATLAVYAPFATHGGTNDGNPREPECRNRRDQQLDLLGQG